MHQKLGPSNPGPVAGNMGEEMNGIARALLSVSDKRGVVDLARGLADLGIELVSSGGTARAITEAGIPCGSVESLTESPEVMGGRVKTLHPRVHGGILFRRDLESDREDAERIGAKAIDLVIVNLYPFDAAARTGDLATAIENIDIGGPTLIRAAAKNHAHVGVVTSPDRYAELLERIAEGRVDGAFRRQLAREAFRHTGRYDAAIAQYLDGLDEKELPLPEETALPLLRVQSLRYGENPHQSAAFYRDGSSGGVSLADAVQHHGKELSFNNFGDLSAACELALEFAHPAAVVIKHANPSGCAVASDLADAYRQARAGDPLSAFGSVVALNRSVDLETAELVAETFVEAVIAPAFAPDALARLMRKKGLRLLELPGLDGELVAPLGIARLDVRRVLGGYLLQSRDEGGDSSAWRVGSTRQPTDDEMAALRFAWSVCRHVKSNAIVLARGRQTIGVGAGQMSRVDSVRIARSKMCEHGHGDGSAVLASDAFFPFRDGVDAAHDAGATAIIQPGGSIRDAEVLEAANEHGMAMVLTGRRHFWH